MAAGKLPWGDAGAGGTSSARPRSTARKDQAAAALRLLTKHRQANSMVMLAQPSARSSSQVMSARLSAGVPAEQGEPGGEAGTTDLDAYLDQQQTVAAPYSPVYLDREQQQAAPYSPAYLNQQQLQAAVAPYSPAIAARAASILAALPHLRLIKQQQQQLAAGAEGRAAAAALRSPASGENVAQLGPASLSSLLRVVYSP